MAGEYWFITRKTNVSLSKIRVSKAALINYLFRSDFSIYGSGFMFSPFLFFLNRVWLYIPGCSWTPTPSTLSFENNTELLPCQASVLLKWCRQHLPGHPLTKVLCRDYCSRTMKGSLLTECCLHFVCPLCARHSRRSFRNSFLRNLSIILWVGRMSHREVACLRSSS